MVMKVNDTISGKLPKFVTDPIANGATVLVKKLLWLNVIITKKYTNPRYYQEIKGIADGSGVHINVLKQLNVFPELIKSCLYCGWYLGPCVS